VSTSVVTFSEGLGNSLLLICLFRLSHSFIIFCYIFYHSIYGCMFCVQLFNCVTLLLCLCILIMCVIFCVFCLIVLFCVLIVCKRVLFYCHRVSTQLQLTNIYHITYSIYHITLKPAVTFGNFQAGHPSQIFPCCSHTQTRSTLIRTSRNSSSPTFPTFCSTHSRFL
jgi:hypothetical protein